jgi:hypothetical protein
LAREVVELLVTDFDSTVAAAASKRLAELDQPGPLSTTGRTEGA